MARKKDDEKRDFYANMKSGMRVVMKNRLYSAVFFALSIVFSTGFLPCFGLELEQVKATLADYVKENFVAPPALARPVPTAVIPKQPMRDWTVMVYMNGRSNVESFAMEDMNELELAGSNDRINVVTELGRMTGTEGDSGPDGKWTGSRRYYVIKDADTSAIKSAPLWSNSKPDMGDYREVISFVQWARNNFPAQKYALIIWDHGWGWMDPSKPMTRSISHDFVSGNAIKTTQLKLMFSQLGQLDMYASMACFMQMMEVSY
ncbi:MAG TPA: clostripain-related cysteine peptidase, partial [Elusimicrobiales bacterium]|nr:clostripain-related cysteine peptidase [Elusimicrobiales bacterium]